jgi:hypothetical protein
MRNSVRIAFYILSATLTIGALEIGSLLALNYLKSVDSTKELIYQPPEIDGNEYARYLNRRDPVLGWPAPSDHGGNKYDISGSRHIPAFPDPGGECVTLYGDSFTYSADVGHVDAWSNALSRILGCRVANFGVAGYGTDQAYLRFEMNGADVAPVSIMGFYPYDAARNLNQYRHLITGTAPLGFKPRFVLDNGEATLSPMPLVERDNWEAFQEAPGRFLRHETFLPDTPLGPARVKFPYSLSLLRAAWDERLFNVLRRRPSWSHFLERGHYSQGCKVAAAIFKKFDRLCRARDKQCFVVLFPTTSSYDYYVRTGEDSARDLIDMMEAQGIDYLNLTPELTRALGERSYCEILTDSENCFGHHNPEGDAMVARLVHEHLLRRGLIPADAPESD